MRLTVRSSRGAPPQKCTLQRVSAMRKGGRVVVVGSLNADLAVAVKNRPEAGETVLGSDLVERAGGKGAYEAVAATRVGAEVAMVGRVGDDPRAELLLAALRDAGVDIDAVEAIAGEASGCALITVTPDGDNAIVVAPGANGRLSAGDIARHGDLLSAAAVVVCQLEIPLEAVLDATARELAEDALLVVNAAPPADLSPPLLERTDVLVVNAPELRALAEGVRNRRGWLERELMTGLLGHGPRAVLATLGADGALLGHGDDCVSLRARSVEVVDTTGAGDAAVGALAAALAAGLTLEDAAAAAAARTAAITAPGPQPPLPALAELR